MTIGNEVSNENPNEQQPENVIHVEEETLPDSKQKSISAETGKLEGKHDLK